MWGLGGQRHFFANTDTLESFDMTKPTSDEIELLCPLRASRARNSAGDLFALHLTSYGFLNGIVVATDAKVGLADNENWNLVYVYDVLSSGLEECRLKSPGSSMLIAPAIINNLGWTRGYIEKIGHISDLSNIRLQKHCFEIITPPGRPKMYVDEYLIRTSTRTEPCGWHGLGNHVSLADECVKELQRRGHEPSDSY